MLASKWGTKPLLALKLLEGFTITKQSSKLIIRNFKNRL